jgi:hypothetical protein
MILRAVAVGGLGLLALLAFGCARVTPASAPMVVVVSGVGGGGVSTTGEEPETEAAWSAKEEVEVEWHGSWFPAIVLERRSGRWLVHYEGYSSDWDEVVSAERIRERRVEPELEESTVVDDEPDP